MGLWIYDMYLFPSSFCYKEDTVPNTVTSVQYVYYKFLFLGIIPTIPEDYVREHDTAQSYAIINLGA